MLKHLICVVLLTMPAYAGDGDFVFGPAHIESDRKILQALQSTVNAAWSAQPLQKVMEDLRKATGVPFNIEPQVFEDVGVDPDLPVTCEFGKVSVQEAIRGLSLEWSIENGAIWLRPEGADETYSTRAYDISKLTRWFKQNSTDGALEAQLEQLEALNGRTGEGATQRRRLLRRTQNDTTLEQHLICEFVMLTTSGPWMVQDQEGGSIDATSDRLFVRQKFSRHLEAAGTLDALEQLVDSDGSLKSVPFRAWGDSIDEEQAVLKAKLDSPTTVKFVDTPLKEAVKFLAEKKNIQFLFELQEGWNPHQKVTLELSDVKLQIVLERMLEPLGLEGLDHDGVISIIDPGTNCGGLHQTVGYRLDQITLAPDPKALTELIHSQTTGKWMAIDQEGGSLIWIGSRILLVNAEPRYQAQVHDLLCALKRSPEGAARVAPDPLNTDVQLYKFGSEKEAKQVRQALPLIADSSHKLAIKRVGKNLVIEATRPGHEQIDRFLKSLKEEEPKPNPPPPNGLFFSVPD